LRPPAHPIAAPSNRETPADAVGAERGLAAQVARSGRAVAEAHDTFLRFSQRGAEALSAGLAAQAQAITALADAGVRVTQPPVDAAAVQPAQPVVFDRAMCMEFATGSVAKVLGPLFAEVDTYRVRVRLPDEPLMLVDRILSVEGEKNALTRGRIVTEHDVRAGDWYLDGGVMPTSITVESGQADLFLCAYLGIDLRVRGARAYRLLDATVAFHRGLPVPGETVRYDIRIDRFVRQGDTYLFFFEFDATIAGRPVLTMRNGCAGFFTDEEIRASGGIIETNEEKAPPKRTGDANWPAWAPPADGERYAEARIDALRRGDLAGAFGEAFANLPLADPVRIPDGRMRLVHRVVHLDSGGGRYGLGVIRAEADIHPDDWFLTCHFVDDMVMPGTLMYECCAHTLRILLMRMGWLAEHAATRYEPVLEVPSALRCRGPVTRATRVVTYEVHVKAIGFGPEPYVLADALMSADGEMIVRFTDMSLRMSGLNRDDLARVWANRAEAGGPAVSSGAIAPIGEIPIPSEAKPAVYGSERIRAFAVGNPSEAFGERYRVFDREAADRSLARPAVPGARSYHRSARPRLGIIHGGLDRGAIRRAAGRLVFRGQSPASHAVRGLARDRTPAVRLAGGLQGVRADQRHRLVFSQSGRNRDVARGTVRRCGNTDHPGADDSSLASGRYDHRGFRHAGLAGGRLRVRGHDQLRVLFGRSPRPTSRGARCVSPPLRADPCGDGVRAGDALTRRSPADARRSALGIG
jgi:3-hydroxymyristoyl/3-hydroxydecanoyl-(acyl carrier protein) dehydratase